MDEANNHGAQPNLSSCSSGSKTARRPSGSGCIRMLFALVVKESQLLAALGSWAIVCILELSSTWPETQAREPSWSCPVALTVFAAGVLLLLGRHFCAHC